MTERKLKPCPFCGNEPTIIVRKGKDGWRDRYSVLCDYEHGGCGAESGWYHYETEAVESWNKRVRCRMTCERSRQCDNAHICQLAQSKEYNLLGGSCFTPKDPPTNEEWLRSATTDGMTEIFMRFMFDAEFKARFVNGNFITEFRKWLKEIHHAE